MTPDRDLECAEYVLGLLDTEERSAVERALHEEAGLQAAVDAWASRLSPLGETVTSRQPPARVWRRIEADLGLVERTGTPQSVPESRMQRFWNSIQFWRLVALATTFAMVAVVAVNLFLVPTSEAPSGLKSAYAATAITGDDGVPHWTATVDKAKREIIVVPAVAFQVSDSASTELWLIPENSKPISLGVFPSNRSTSIVLSKENAAKLNARSALAVSVEPKGGSPTGQATGPVVGKGAMHET
ncbi:RNA polymerase subunit sigma-70 [Ralstonia pickettii]|uniref:RNA polymerase subunit sigma-70 n=1 Tax=Ralstonia pickettii TaxID=329 RepID=A0A7X2LA99_RALPI|nr:anti-sigma factor [Ralstonia pickettii]MRS97922.1 RNA polymerase subunit sigma-70 [Ralstonia pickettii]NWK47539.1 anti-sigma factor [Ralstonia pickettii]WKZ88320.1 anti-sigma factor [Ralstonia pickettii]